MRDDTKRQRRRENGGKRQKLCSRCSMRAARHQVGGDRLCCQCYVGGGYLPAEWHPDCVAAAAALREAKR
jgi:hypothetical protein